MHYENLPRYIREDLLPCQILIKLKDYSAQHPSFYLLQSAEGSASPTEGQRIPKLLKVCDRRGYNVKTSIHNSKIHSTPIF